MKALKFLITVCIFGFFSAGIANAQTDRATWTETWVLQNSWNLPCLDETLTGEMKVTYTYIWKEGIDWLKWQVRYKGIFKGDVTGDIYAVSEIENDHQVLNANAGNWYYLQNFILHKNGKPVAKGHILLHGTANDATWNKKEGNWAAYIENIYFECL